MPLDDEPQPQLGKPLPNAAHADIERDKLVRYALDPDSEPGRHKAHVFRVTLDIVREDADYLIDAIVAALPDHPVTAARPPRGAHGTYTWEVLVPISGLRRKAERCLNVITAWEMSGGRPRLVTLRVAPRRRQTSL